MPELRVELISHRINPKVCVHGMAVPWHRRLEKCQHTMCSAVELLRLISATCRAYFIISIHSPCTRVRMASGVSERMNAMITVGIHIHNDEVGRTVENGDRVNIQVRTRDSSATALEEMCLSLSSTLPTHALMQRRKWKSRWNAFLQPTSITDTARHIPLSTFCTKLLRTSSSPSTSPAQLEREMPLPPFVWFPD